MDVLLALRLVSSRCGIRRGRDQHLENISGISQAGVEINARPLARGEWKSRGMSRIFAQVVRRASGYLNLFCQLYAPTNESNY